MDCVIPEDVSVVIWETASEVAFPVSSVDPVSVVTTVEDSDVKTVTVVFEVAGSVLAVDEAGDEVVDWGT